jgi:hypothetical protein
MENMIMTNMSVRKMVDPSYVVKAMNYDEYRRLIAALIIDGKSTSKKDSAKFFEYSKLNVVRMNRLDKTTEIIPVLKKVIEQIDEPQTWLVVTEGWCGDAAQVVPVFDKIAQLNSNIDLKFLLRDENLELMDQFLTDDKSRSIPKLLVIDQNFEELFNWGPRPKPLQKMFYHMKANAINNDTIQEIIHGWYARDKTITIQNEILDVHKSLDN